ncbi:hypothetical protein M9H77_26353 [Catharanthus roseus]|uniref:Uncharacterized protein n=1 Tax=Catharanthus roseus TaxID=4058 RepID=A0ACC0ABA3_CATRO|nr:hypothetical protein M9H77_26353 [Catharanthus roseus]
MELKNGPITKAQRRKLKAFEDNAMVGLRVKKGLPSCSSFFHLARTKQGNKLEEKLANPAPTVVDRLLPAPSLEDVNLPRTVGLTLPSPKGLIMSTDGHLPTQSHQGGTSDHIRMYLNETLRSMQQSLEGLTR